MLNFESVWKKCLEIVFPLHSPPHFIVWLFLLFEIFCNMCIAIVHFPGSDVIGFEINLFKLSLFYK